jgi:hypothetical protein
LASLLGANPAEGTTLKALRDLVIFTASHKSDILRNEVQKIPADGIKAYLLLYEAAGRGLEHSRSGANCNSQSQN